jgi:hypothetical protein
MFGSGGVGAEFGACHGINAMQMYHVCKPSKLYLIDPWFPIVCFSNGGGQHLAANSAICVDHSERFGGTYEGLVHSYFSSEIDSGAVELCKTTAYEWMLTIPDDSLDFVYIDTRHELEETYQELSEAKRVVKPDGIISGHDFMVFGPPICDGVITPVLEFINDGLLKVEAMSYEHAGGGEFPFPSYFCRNVK